MQGTAGYLSAVAIGIVLGGTAIYLIAGVLATAFEKQLNWLAEAIRTLRLPFLFAVAAFSLKLAVAEAPRRLESVDPWLTERQEFYVQRGLSLLVVIALTLGAVRALRVGLRTYEKEVSAEDPELARDVQTRNSLIRKLITPVILFIATIYALRETGAEITPLIAGGTVGGIILGLALQDSLSNFFAGIFLNMDRPARLGDLIRLENGEEGFLHEIGWRTTKIRTWSNNLLVIPNNKFAQMPLTNLERPSSAATATVDFLIAHDNDLNLVERLALEAALEAREACEDPEEEPPVVRFRTLTEMGVGIRVLVRSSSSGGQYRLAHETMRRLHAKLREHAIRFAQPR